MRARVRTRACECLGSNSSETICHETANWTIYVALLYKGSSNHRIRRIFWRTHDTYERYYPLYILLWWSISLTFGEHRPTERRVGRPQSSDNRSLLRRNSVYKLLRSLVHHPVSSLTLRRWAVCDYLLANIHLFLLPPMSNAIRHIDREFLDVDGDTKPGHNSDCVQTGSSCLASFKIRIWSKSGNRI